jgi:hypothetical protein
VRGYSPGEVLALFFMSWVKEEGTFVENTVFLINGLKDF